MNDTVVYENVDAEPRVSPLVPMSIVELLRAVVTGAGVGLIVALVYFLMNKFVFGAVMCRPQSMTQCAQAPMYAYAVATVVGIIAGVAALVRMRIYRPLLAVLAAAIALWGVHTLLANVVWYWALVVAMLMFGVAYGLFAWLARIRSFILALVVTIAVVVIMRLLIAA